MANVKEINKEEFEKEVLNNKIPTLIDFYATWCGPCKALAPILENTAPELAGKVNIVKIDVDKAEDIARKYRVMSVPTMVLIDGGKEKDRLVGLLNKQMIIDRINKNIK